MYHQFQKNVLQQKPSLQQVEKEQDNQMQGTCKTKQHLASDEGKKHVMSQSSR